MTKKNAFFILFVLFTNITFSQSLNFEKKSKDEIFEFEKNNSGLLIEQVKEFGILKSPQNDLNSLIKTKAYIFKKTNDDFDPQLHVWYFFGPKDKQMKGIKYNWGLLNPEYNYVREKERIEKLGKNEKEFVEKYTSLKNKFQSEFGEPVKLKTIADNENSFIENVFWEDSSKIIGLTIKFDRKLKTIPMVGTIGDYEVSIMITFK